jgi:hypothetical protein
MVARSTRALALLAGGLLSACPGPVDTAQEEAPFLGADPTVPAAPGEARAGVIREGEAGEAALFGGISAEGRAGDIKIYNQLVQLIVQGPYPSHGYVPTGGGIIDADLVRPDHQLSRDLVEDVYLGFSMARLFHADTVEVLADGSDGGDAVVQARGTDVAWTWFQGMFEREDPVVEAMGLEITTTYTLAPDSYHLRIRTEIHNPGDDSLSLAPQDGAWVSGEDFIPWELGSGYDELDADTRRALFMTGRQGEHTLALWQHHGEYGTGVITSLAAEYGMILAELEPVELAPGEAVVYERSLTIAPSPAWAIGAILAADDEPRGQVCGLVNDESGPLAGARVHLVRDPDDPQVESWALTDAEGAFCATLTPGELQAYAVGHGPIEHVQLPEGRGRYAPFAAQSVNDSALAVFRGEVEAQAPAWARGRASGEPVSLEVEDGETTTIELTLGRPGRLEISLEDEHGAPLPGVLELRWAEGAPPASTIPSQLHGALEIPEGGRAGWAWTADGVIALDVLPGSYDLQATHDWRHERAEASAVEVLAGEATRLTLVLERVIEHDGWLALDAHLHGAPSFDGALPMADRLVACAATGVDIAAISEHDLHVDYAPLLEAMGLRSRLLTIPTVEVTTMLRGHFNLWPLVPAPREEPNGGALDWWNHRVSTEELFGLMREAAGPGALLQVNHPRTPGMLTFADFDPAVGEAEDPDAFSWDFETFELINGGVADLEQVREDYFGFLNHGHVRVPLGVSDSHYRFIPCGMGRTDIPLDADSAGEIDQDAVVEALLAGHTVAATGVTLRAWAGDALPGETVTGERIELEVEVLAPSWIVPDSLRLIRDGEILREEPLEHQGGGLWFSGTLTAEAERDAWFALEVVGGTPMGDAWRNQTPYAMTSAFLLDVEGDGWEAPGP